ncbi:glutamyl-tRNA(Gln) amidotransferase subunit A [Plasmodium gonderi]|uniref:Glutamyl-tRNA(Gln) amidotransferase subunit A n=1 Tax=Plasmodium gonderi TaxID=77519 RepID=A0A1Y1JEM4_PLAGO|nr:glutamyl-tRNA(Gln) amidotransferase subunit A [Plasmodium gonderi]GAW79785.1 glutamyl-tRNA(Gln) amidotransferase subunit A [Plasmodium gonderi]
MGNYKIVLWSSSRVRLKLFYIFLLFVIDKVIFKNFPKIYAIKLKDDKRGIFKKKLSNGRKYTHKCKKLIRAKSSFYILGKCEYSNMNGKGKKKKKCTHIIRSLKNSSTELNTSEIYKIREEILSKKDIKDVLERNIINKVSNENINKYNSFSYIYSIDEIYEQVRKLYKIYDQCKNLDKLPKLFGLPIILKDNIVTRNIHTSASSDILENYKPSYDSTVVKKLNQHGAIILGKTHLDQFAMGSCTGGKVKNPFNENALSCGGSSSGSASCVGSRIINCSVNTDTGGSIRTPAALCACIGLKPTYGRISRYGIIPYNEETDVVGLIVNNVYDCSILLDALCGWDKNDLTSLKKKKKKFHFKLRKYALSEKFISGQYPLRNFKFGYLSKELLKYYFVDDNVCKNYEQVMQHIEQMGGILINTNIFKLIDYTYLYYMYSMTIANSNLSRINGINYNIPNSNGTINFVRQLRSNLINENVHSRIIGGSIISSCFQKGNIRNLFLSAKRRLKHSIQKIFHEVTYVLLPSLPKSNNLITHGVTACEYNTRIHSRSKMEMKKDSSSIHKKNMNEKNRDEKNVNEKNRDEKNVNAKNRDEKSANAKNRDEKNILHAQNHVQGIPYQYNNYMKEIFSVVASITGYPSIVIPTGEFTEHYNEPKSFQVLSKNLNEAGLLKVALAYKSKFHVDEKILQNLGRSKNETKRG